MKDSETKTNDKNSMKLQPRRGLLVVLCFIDDSKESVYTCFKKVRTTTVLSAFTSVLR